MNLFPGPNRKPIAEAWREIEEQRDRAEVEALNRSERVTQILREHGEDDPRMTAIMHAMQEMNAAPSIRLPVSERDLRGQALNQMVYSTPNIYVEKHDYGGWTIWDFDHLIGAAVSLKKTRDDRVLITTFTTTFELPEIVGQMFERYLASLWVFQVAAMKVPCPVCTHPDWSLGKECQACGGVGWVVNQKAAAAFVAGGPR